MVVAHWAWMVFLESSSEPLNTWKHIFVALRWTKYCSMVHQLTPNPKIYAWVYLLYIAEWISKATGQTMNNRTKQFCHSNLTLLEYFFCFTSFYRSMYLEAIYNVDHTQHTSNSWLWTNSDLSRMYFFLTIDTAGNHWQIIEVCFA